MGGGKTENILTAVLFKSDRKCCESQEKKKNLFPAVFLNQGRRRVLVEFSGQPLETLGLFKSWLNCFNYLGKFPHQRNQKLLEKLVHSYDTVTLPNHLLSLGQILINTRNTLSCRGNTKIILTLAITRRNFLQVLIMKLFSLV